VSERGGICGFPEPALGQLTAQYALFAHAQKSVTKEAAIARPEAASVQKIKDNHPERERGVLYHLPQDHLAWPAGD
jgi:hypothetical protein